MQAYVHALRAWGLFNYMLHKYDMFITVVCSVVLIYLHCANVKCFPKNSLMSIFISNDLDTDIDIETHDNSHLIPTSKLHRKLRHLMVLNKCNQV